MLKMPVIVEFEVGKIIGYGFLVYGDDKNYRQHLLALKKQGVTGIQIIIGVFLLAAAGLLHQLKEIYKEVIMYTKAYCPYCDRATVTCAQARCTKKFVLILIRQPLPE